MTFRSTLWCVLLALLCAAVLAGCGSAPIAAIPTASGALPYVPPAASPSSTAYVPPYPIAHTPYPLPVPSPTSIPILETFAPDFAVAVIYRTCSTQEVNFLTNTFTQERLTEPSISVPITLTTTEQHALFQQMQQIAFDTYPATFAIDISGASMVESTSGPTDYTFTVRNAGRTKVVHWHDDIVSPTIPAAEKLRQLANTISAMAERQPSVKNLPPLPFGCA